MKLYFLTALSILAFAQNSIAAPKYDLNKFLFVGGGFGKDGASGRPTPLPNSIQSSKAIFDALQAPVNAKGKKAVGVEIRDDILGLECSDQGCQVTLVVPAAKIAQGMNKEIQFGGNLAKGIFDALPANADNRVGASTKTVANLSCSRISARGFPTKCTIKNMNFTVISMAEVGSQGEMSREQIEEIIDALGISSLK